jgi:2'-5' RNA ligase
MGFLAISYPGLEDDDRNWIQAVRRRYDPHFELVAPHFSLVFEVDAIDQTVFIEHIRSRTRKLSPIEFCLRSAMANYGASEKRYYLFLVPSEGNSAIRDWHDRLYTGILTKHLRTDIPYIPHITIGIFDTAEKCREICKKINGVKFEMRGRLDSLDIVSIDGDKLETVEKIELSN